MTHTQLQQANAINKQIVQKEQELETFKESMNFGGQLPERIKISNADAPYLPLILENKVVAMVILDTILEQYNTEITELQTQLQAI
tara:strand:+ start:472 stop:729 length:258 start_codon:yes stop_codon:yes gene_type:complete